MEVNLVVAFGSGLASFFAPCVVPLLPAYVGYISGVAVGELTSEDGERKYKKQVLWSSLWYILGFSVVFVILGTAAAGLGSLVRDNSVGIQRVGGVVIMLLAASFLGLIKLPGLGNGYQMKLPKWVSHLGYGRAFVVGVIFATAWSPCVGPVLGVILTLAAASQTATSGAWMLFVYSLGISVPFLVISMSMMHAPKVVSSVKTYLPMVSRMTGVLLFVIGFLLFNNTVGLISEQLTYNRLNGWLFQVAAGMGYRIR